MKKVTKHGPRRDYKALEVEIVKVAPLDPVYGEVTPFDLPAIYAPDPISVMMRNIPFLKKAGRYDTPDANAVPRSSGGFRPAGKPSVPVDDELPPLPPGIDDGSEADENPIPRAVADAGLASDEPDRSMPAMYSAPAPVRQTQPQPKARPSALPAIPPELGGDLNVDDGNEAVPF
jgi:hypothetical protein